MPTKNKTYPTHCWYLEYRDGSSDKFYQVFVTETGVCVLRWGRRGAAGQNSVTAYASYDEARDQGLKQVFAKKSKGYVSKYDGHVYMATEEAIARARRSDISALDEEFHASLQAGQFDGAKTTVLKHYDEFSEKVKVLMDRAGSDSSRFDEVMGEYQELEKVWEEINDRHAEVSAAMSIANATLFQKLMGQGYA